MCVPWFYFSIESQVSFLIIFLPVRFGKLTPPIILVHSEHQNTFLRHVCVKGWHRFKDLLTVTTLLKKMKTFGEMVLSC